jgi:hypothetical protein
MARRSSADASARTSIEPRAWHVAQRHSARVGAVFAAFVSPSRSINTTRSSYARAHEGRCRVFSGPSTRAEPTKTPENTDGDAFSYREIARTSAS